MDIDEVISIIKDSPSSLFYGTGVSSDCGGPSWKELLSDLKRKFPGIEDDPFKYMDGIISFDDSNRKEIEDFLRTRLAAISPKDNQKYLFSLPWRAALTTNYDHLPDIVGITLDESRQIVPISDPAEQTDHRRVDRLYCFKLLGDVKFSSPQGGWMVLSESDLFSAGDRRIVFFNQFRNLATTGHIVYLGHSFEDDVVFRILSQMKTALGRFPWKGFAITPSEPNIRMKKKLDSIGIEWVKGDLDDFVIAAKKRFGEIPSSSPLQMGCLTIHQKTIDMDRSVLSNIHNKFSILHNELLQSVTEKPIDFLRGTSESFFPYVYNWDFPRKTKLEWRNGEAKTSLPPTLLDLKLRVKDEELSHNALLALVGGAGSGKTVVAYRLSFEWYQTGNPVIFINPDNRNIDQDAIDGLMNEIRDKYLAKVEEAEKEYSHPIRWLIVADDCGINILDELRLLRNHLISSGKPCDIVLVARETDVPIEKLKISNVDAIYRLDDTIVPQEVDVFLRHFKRFGILDEDIVQRNLVDKEINSSFFALMYSCVRQSNENIRRLLLKEYGKLDEESRKVYSLVSLIQAYRLQPLSSLLIKSGPIDPDWLQNQIMKGSLGGVVRQTDFGNVLLTSNRLIAETICEIAFPNSLERKLGLSKVISGVTYGDYAEMAFLDILLNSRIEQDMGPRVSN
jgi:hypothetical protein